MAKKSAHVVSDKEGRQYHIGCKPGDVAPYILMCGDPKRAHRVAGYFDDKRDAITSREYVTITGTYKDVPLTVMATGMGPDNTEMAFVELSQIVERPTMIRIGSSSGLKPEIALGDVIISSGGVRLENTSTSYVMEGYPAVAHYECVLALLQAADELKVPHHVGLTATAPGFYAAQGRRVPGFAPRREDITAELERMNVANFEMETSCLFTLAAYRGFRAGAVCAAYGNRHRDEFVEGDLKDAAEKRCVEVGLAAMTTLAKMDAAKKGSPHWLPSMKV